MKKKNKASAFRYRQSQFIARLATKTRQPVYLLFAEGGMRPKWRRVEVTPTGAKISYTMGLFNVEGNFSITRFVKSCFISWESISVREALKRMRDYDGDNDQPLIAVFNHCGDCVKTY